MVEINMRVVKIILLLIVIIITVSNCSPVSSLRLEHKEASDDDSALPLDSSNSPKRPITSEDTYDQRQNGTENYRVQIDGLVLFVAPIEALLLAGSIPHNFSDILAPPVNTQRPLDKPQENESIAEAISKPIENQKLLEPKNIGHRGQLKLISLLTPFLRHMGHR